MTTWRYLLNRWSEWDEIRATNRRASSWTCDKVWCEKVNRFGDSACFKVFEFSACSCWISRPILIKLGSWHFFGKAHLLTKNQGWGCVIAKVDPSKISWWWPKSADFFDILYIWVRKWIWTKKNMTSFYQPTSADVSWCQLIKWGHNFFGPNSFSCPSLQHVKKISWFGPLSADFWGVNFGNHTTSALTFGGKMRLAQKVSAAKYD